MIECGVQFSESGNVEPYVSWTKLPSSATQTVEDVEFHALKGTCNWAWSFMQGTPAP